MRFKNIGLKSDDGLAVLKNVKGPASAKIKNSYNLFLSKYLYSVTWKWHPAANLWGKISTNIVFDPQQTFSTNFTKFLIKTKKLKLMDMIRKYSKTHLLQKQNYAIVWKKSHWKCFFTMLD